MLSVRATLLSGLACAVAFALSSCTSVSEPSWDDRVDGARLQVEDVDFDALGAVEVDCGAPSDDDAPPGSPSSDGIARFCWEFASADPVELIDVLSLEISEAGEESHWVWSSCSPTGWRELAFIPGWCSGYVLDGANPGSYWDITLVPHYDETDFFDVMREARERDGYISVETMDLLPEPRIDVVVLYIDPAVRELPSD